MQLQPEHCLKRELIKTGGNDNVITYKAGHGVLHAGTSVGGKHQNNDQPPTPSCLLTLKQCHKAQEIGSNALHFGTVGGGGGGGVLFQLQGFRLACIVVSERC